MKPPLISLITILFLALLSPVVAQNGAHPVSQAAYRVGEKLTYNISYSNFPSAAHAEFEVVSRGVFYGRDAIQLRAHLETAGVINVALFSINNDYLTYIEPETGLPFRSQETARDAIKSAEAAQDFTQPPPAGNEAIPPKTRALAGVFDFLSAFYRARALPLADGAEYDLTVRGEGANYPVELKVIGRETVRTNVGSFETIVAQVKADTRFKRVKVYFSSDERHVPVLFTGRLNSGELRAELAGSEMIAPAPGTGPVAPPIMPSRTPVVIVPPTPPRVEGGWPFPLDEQLNYQVFLGPATTPMGTASFQVKGRSRYFDRDGIFLTVTAQTTNAAARLFVARDQIDSYVDPRGLLPYRTVLNLVEGKRRLNQTRTVNQETGIVTTDNGTRIEIPVGTHDYLSFFYALRMFNLTLTKRNMIPVLVENKPKTLIVAATKRESISLGSRAVPAVALTITTDDPEPDKYQLRLWVSDDDRHLPLRLAANTRLGPLRADLAILPTTPQ